jgi:siroheme synthase
MTRVATPATTFASPSSAPVPARPTSSRCAAPRACRTPTSSSSIRSPTRRCASSRRTRAGSTSASAASPASARAARRAREHRPGHDQRPPRQARAERRRVVRLKGGDPSVFGRLEEELEALAAAGIECEVVPGVTAALAAAAATQRPLTRRGAGRSVALTTAMTKTGELVAGRHADTESFYMAGKQLAALSRRLVAAGWPAQTPALVVSRAGWPDQIASEHVVATLGDATVLHSGRPTVVTVGVGAAAIGATPVVVTDDHALPATPAAAMPEPATAAPARATTPTP